MEFRDQPAGFFITWTVYGTFLQGDVRWWRKKGGDSKPPQPLLEQWHRNRLKHAIVLLTKDHRQIVATAVVDHCRHRNWKLWKVNPRSNHVHVVVTAVGCLGDKVRDQLKANATRCMRTHDAQFVGRPVWSTRGDVQHLKTEDDIEQEVEYAGEGQDRMGRGK